MCVLGSAERASSLDHLCSQQSPGLRGQRSRFAKNRREAECNGDGEGEEGLMSPTEEDGGGYGAFTLPCRRSHCLSEGLAGLGIPAAPCPAFQGRRAQTTQVRSQFMYKCTKQDNQMKSLFCLSFHEYIPPKCRMIEDFVYQSFPGSSGSSHDMTTAAGFNILLTTRDISCASSCSVLCNGERDYKESDRKWLWGYLSNTGLVSRSRNEGIKT